MTETATNPARPEVFRETVAAEAFGVLEQPLTPWEKAWNTGALRKGLLLVALALAWQMYARALNNPLLVPTFTATLAALWEGVAAGPLLTRAAFSIKVLLMGYGAGC